ncbi:MAG: ParB/RepB/Spo0J family partition protein [Nitrincola lacisaponensis]|uniref:Probable chromosome-partitioning protein ParB n=1 Tax=Nitrincola lacisaponensis TaxID=267850 RepID=A0A063Y8S3_9GAMM|nr:ParB/RepB/Spo0J family partition protein [Nitrincola lacisaponensis]KDE41465.1 Chromosome (plasmid) partitioning protein ParB [Nitrincola lacisaponensis]
MVVKKRGLGRGLDALLSGMSDDTESPLHEAAEPLSTQGELQHMDINRIERGRYQPRRDMEPQALEELAESIRAQGVMQPIVVRPIADNRYEIIAGERRWRATQMAGLSTIPTIIRDVPDEAAIAMALIENIQRENLNPMEEAVALHRLQTEFELTQQQVADAVGKSRSTIANLLRLMNLTEDVRKMLEYGDLEMGHARALLGLEGEQQVEAAAQVVSRALSVRETELLVKKYQSGEISRKPTAPVQNETFKEISGLLSRHFSAPVKIAASAQGKGKISISFNSQEQLDAILARLDTAQDI